MKPFKEVSRDTLTHLVCQVKAKAGLDVSKFSPHSTRAAWCQLHIELGLI